MKNKVCVVTGGAQGIGKAIVENFINEGAKIVYALDTNEKLLKDLEIQNKNVIGYVLNVLDRDAIKIFVDEVKNKYGKIDVLVNNAGITKDGLIQKMSEEDWNMVVDVNLKGVFNMTQEIVKIMLDNSFGSIVNMASIVGEVGNIGQTNYAATKGGVIAMTKTWAKEFARKGQNIRVNAVAPGFIKTPMTEKIPKKVIESIKSKIILKRMGEAFEIANAVTFLSSEKSSYITGHVLDVNGGTIL
ncbi:beta-ketoacyl-ACP reductase [Tepiditoga spiralis]|uniref:Beta-ketoacyl-ACP reductase n=1 Tax=Tepiditoga spiralis TaxID=2108365 RepID=A0A7G1G4R7_9BACT|nr:beta-ketoacyl-ACP reductase [Tepiditoga spiralis]BBE31530.1 beta-ketoacyl-ACP reductase [Tepiditoga spiralis]